MKQKAEDFFCWESSLDTGIEKIDKQHRKLVHLINEFYHGITQGEAHGMLEMLLQRLVEYTKLHFKDEEEILIKNNYPDLKEHQKKHRVLTAEVEAYCQKFNEGKEEFAEDLMHFLKAWLIEHIQNSDMDYKPYIKTFEPYKKK